jgi:hypothetical protein
VANRARDFVAKFLTDTSKFDTDEPVKELDTLADQSDTTAKRMDSSFDRIKRSSDSNLDNLAADGTRKAGEAGREVGTEFAANIGESIASGQANIGDLLAGTLGGLVAVPGLGIAAAGLGVAGLFVKGILDGVSRSKAALAEATQRAVDSIDVDLSTFAAKFDASKFLSESIDALTEGGLAEDIKRFQQLAKSGVGEETLTRILAGTATAADRASLEGLIKEVDARVSAVGTHGADVHDSNFKAAHDVLDLLNQQTTAYEDGVTAVETQIRAQQRLAGYIETNMGLLSRAEASALGQLANKPQLRTDDW